LVNKKIVKIKKAHFGNLTHELINQKKPHFESSRRSPKVKKKKVLKPCLVNKKIVKIKKIHFSILTHELINQKKPTSSPQKDHQKSKT
jgi:hypothetical protein